MDVLQRFALVDCAVDVPIVYRRLQKYAKDALVPARCLFDGQQEASLAHAGPWLIALTDAESAPQLESWLTTLEHHYPAVSWITGCVDYQTLFVHLESQLDIRFPDGTLGMHRFWDPRAWVRLQRILTLPQRIEFMGPIQTWRAVCRGQHYCVTRTGDSLQEDITDADTHP